MPTRARLALLALLIAAAVLAVRARAAMTAPSPVPLAPPAPGGDGQGGGLALLALIAAPFLALLVVAALLYPLERRASRPEVRRTTVGQRQLLVVVVLIALVAALALFARAVRGQATRPRATRGGTRADPSTTPAEPIPAPDARGGGVDFELLAALTVGGMLLLVLAAVLANRRRRVGDNVSEEDLDAVPAGASRRTPLVEATVHALAGIDAPARTPREAIVRCYAALERALADSASAVPRPADTPTDVLDRATEAGLVRHEYGTRLVALFTEARFSSHPMTENDRASAADTLRLILDDLRRPSWTRS